MRKKAFTLVELLVVISIIGILAGIVTVSLSSARAKARDAKRKTDLETIKTALEMYYDENKNYHVKCNNTPTSGYSGASTGGEGLVNFVGGNYICSIISGLMNFGYLSNNIKEPFSDKIWVGSYRYDYFLKTSVDYQKYTLYAKLETFTDLNSDGFDDTSSGGTPQDQNEVGSSSLWKVNYYLGN